MEQWQIEHIEQNMLQLTRNIKVTKTLLLLLIKGNVINEEIADTVLKCESPTAKSQELLQVIQTRPSYYLLTEVLEEDRQLGAAAILKDHEDFQPTINEKNSSSPKKSKINQGNLPPELIVGDYDCKVNRILKTLRKQPSSYRLLGKWKDLSRDLDLSESFICQLEARVRYEGMAEMDILNTVLCEWRSTKAKGATLQKLIKEFHENEMQDLADALLIEFS